MSHRGSYSWQVSSTHGQSSHMVAEMTVATAGSTGCSCATPDPGWSISILGGSSMVRDLAISLNPRGGTLSLASGSSPSWAASSGELPDEVEQEISLRSCHSSSRKCQALFHWLELWLWQHHQRSPGLQGILPTEAAIWEECTFTHLGYSHSVGLLALPVVFKGLGGLAGLSTDAAEMVTQVTNSTSDVAGVAIRAADTFSSTDATMAKTAELSAAGGSMGLGWVVSSISVSGNPCTRPSKTLQSWNVVYLLYAASIHVCSSRKGQVHWAQADWPSLPSMKGLCIGQGPLQGFQSDVLVRQVIWPEHTLFDTFWHRGHSVLLMVPEGLTSDSQNLKGCTYFLSQLLRIPGIQYGGQLLPPVGCIKLAGLPFQPHLVVIDWWLWQWTSPIPGALHGSWHF